jgi:hypothetical protein
MKFFKKYYECTNSGFVNSEEKKEKKDLFNLSLRPRINKSSVSVQNIFVKSTKVDFNNQLNFGFGIEAEFLFPFNKNKWAIVIEPTYQNFNSEKEIYSDYVGGVKVLNKINYSSIEFPLSLRHYLFFNKDSKLFINASYVVDFCFNSSIVIKGKDNFLYDNLDIQSKSNIAFGIGYKYKNKYSMEMRYQSDRQLLPFTIWDSNYNALSFIIGYTIF